MQTIIESRLTPVGDADFGLQHGQQVASKRQAAEHFRVGVAVDGLGHADRRHQLRRLRHLNAQQQEHKQQQGSDHGPIEYPQSLAASDVHNASDFCGKGNYRRGHINPRAAGIVQARQAITPASTVKTTFSSLRQGVGRSFFQTSDVSVIPLFGPSPAASWMR